MIDLSHAMILCSHHLPNQHKMQLQRLVCREFRDAGQERIRERGGRKLYEEGRAFVFGEDHQIIDEQRGELLLQAARGAGCRTLDVQDRMCRLSLWVIVGGITAGR